MGQLCRHLQGWRVLWLRLLRSRWAPGAASSILGQVQDLGGAVGSRVSQGLLLDPGTWEAACGF